MHMMLQALQSSPSALPLQGETTDLLLVLTERFKFCVLQYDAVKGASLHCLVPWVTTWLMACCVLPSGVQASW